eukprot:jgi/Botrbrau1/18716/Bobra.0386s0041.1
MTNPFQLHSCGQTSSGSCNLHYTRLQSGTRVVPCAFFSKEQQRLCQLAGNLSERGATMHTCTTIFRIATSSQFHLRDKQQISLPIVKYDAHCRQTIHTFDMVIIHLKR